MLTKKGIIAQGYDADLVLFDYEKLEDTPNYHVSNQTCKGIEAVFVNGQIVYREGRLTGAASGEMLMHKV